MSAPWVKVPLSFRRLLFWAAAIFAFVMAVLPHLPEVPGGPNDKVQHIVAFATLALLGGWAYPRASLVQMFAGLSLFGALIEVAQAIPALHRDSDVKDWRHDCVRVGAAAGRMAAIADSEPRGSVSRRLGPQAGIFCRESSRTVAALGESMPVARSSNACATLSRNRPSGRSG